MPARVCQLPGYTTRAPAAEETAPLTFSFSASKSAANIQIASGIVVPFKAGWQYLWTFHQDKEDTASYDLVKTPRAAYVENIYESGDFDKLGIPDPWPF